MNIYTRGVDIKDAPVLKNGKQLTVGEVLRQLNTARHFKYPIGASIHNPFDPDLRGMIIGQMYQAENKSLNQREGKMYMIKTETGAVSELEFIFEKDAEFFAEQEEEAVA